MPLFTLLGGYPPKVRHMPRASFHSTGSAPLCVSHISHASLRFLRLCTAVFLTHAPCLSSLCLAVIRPVADTCSVLRFTLLGCDPLCFSHMRHASLHTPHYATVPRITLLRSAAPPIHTRAPCPASPCSSLLLPASDTCTVPCFTLLVSAALGVRRTLLCSNLSAWLCSALLHTNAPCFTSLPRRAPLSFSHMHHASLHPPAL